MDGSVSDEDMFNTPEEIRPKRPSEEFLQEHRRLVEERKRKGEKRTVMPSAGEEE
jgi:hypothetical protein